MSSTHWGKREIEACLPHRDAALFISEAWLDERAASEVAPGRDVSGGGIARWQADHAVLRGHFPELPIVPAVFLIEAAAQIAGVLMVQVARGIRARTVDLAVPLPRSGPSPLGMLSGLRKVLVHRPVQPLHDVRYELQLRPAGAGHHLVFGTGTADGHKVITLELMINVVERAQVFAQSGRDSVVQERTA
jgi:3-hydroxyacyl-[acyl-carrier-protein] dehydratase